MKVVRVDRLATVREHMARLDRTEHLEEERSFRELAEMVSDLLDWGEIVLRTGSFGKVTFGFALINSHWSTNREDPTPRAKEEKAAKSKAFYARTSIQFARFIEVCVNRYVMTDEYQDLKKKGLNSREYQIKRRRQEERELNKPGSFVSR